MIGEIAVEAATFAIDKPYSYRFPDGMTLSPGQRVRVSFGKGNRITEGIVLAVRPGEGDGLKAVEAALEDEPLLSDLQLRLAAFLRERYFCTFYDAIRAMLPAGAWFRMKSTLRLTADRSWQDKKLRKEGTAQILRKLEAMGGTADTSTLRACVPDEDKFYDAVAYLTKKKWLESDKRFLPPTGAKTEKVAFLAVTPEQAMEFVSRRGASAAMQKSVMALMASLGSAAVKDITYYTGASAATVKRLEKLGYLTLTERTVLRCKEIRPVEVTKPLVLNEEQEKCFQGLRRQMEQETPGVALLYGVTGSGKTQVYIRLIQDCLDGGKSAVLLVPEIALTPQLLGILAAWFGNQVAVLHSSLSVGERYDQWNRVRRGEARVVVGTRSAVFAPCVRLGLFILDEEQEHSYKSENSPRYSAREVALWRGVKENAMVLLGSATPSVESMYRGKTGDDSLYTLHSRYNGQPLPAVEIVDMGQELRKGNDTSISVPLRDGIRDTFQKGQQTILLLNRRGNSRALVCVDCGKAPECPRCGIRMTYHSANARLMCHYCGYSQPAPQRCPNCGGPLKAIGAGTQKIQQELAALLPEIPVMRMDADTVSAVNTHEKLLGDFEKGKASVLVGTQMVAKGLNLPNVTLVGVLDADISLFTGGYRSGETTFNLITQVVGRAGRGSQSGRAILQTYVPENTVLNLAARQDYDGFYELEIGLRRVRNAPPFGDFLEVIFQGQEEQAVLRGAMKFRDSLTGCLRQGSYTGEKWVCLGPAPCLVPKINYHYRYQLTLNCRMGRPLRQLIAYLLREFGKDKMNRGVTAYVDVNGYE